MGHMKPISSSSLRSAVETSCLVLEGERARGQTKPDEDRSQGEELPPCFHRAGRQSIT